MHGGGVGGGHGGAMMGGEGRDHHESTHQPMEENAQNEQGQRGLVSYAAAEGIDISVGFPLGSSTPTRK